MQLLSVSSCLSSNDLLKANRFSLIDLAVHTISLCPSVEIDTAVLTGHLGMKIAGFWYKLVAIMFSSFLE